MTTGKKETFLKDYTPPAYLVDRVDLRVELDPHATLVQSRLQCRANAAAGAPLVLDGERLTLMRVAIDGVDLGPENYTFGNGQLIIPHPPAAPFEVAIDSRIDPEGNTALEGLYRSSGNYCTQCEAQGFRTITCFPDRPDVMSVFTTTVVGDRTACPVLLANGNCIDRGDLPDGRHWATWHDPFPKPSYLFALVAGDLVCLTDTFITRSGRSIDLRIYVEPRNRDKCDHAMRALKKAMRWDEERFGREYDLDIYMIVAVDDFNMGAMENKGLNVFNSKYVLALPETATDTDYEGIEAVIAHEYFHNWTGNRITCRDWFQLSLKEGLTVFRDQEFTADLVSRPVKRIQDVNIIRSLQFREDAGPMAHPVRPPSFVEINNFYTLTVYNKGAEVIRMLHTLLGEAGFRRGMDLYFERHDGQAVTCDDFASAIADANPTSDLARLLPAFKRWYCQAGTPHVHATGNYDAASRTYTLTLTQSCAPTPGQSTKEPFVIPVELGLLSASGAALPLQMADESVPGATSRTVVLTEPTQTLTFVHVDAEPVPSLLRNFSAPVVLDIDYTDAQLLTLLAHDADAFNRWEAGQRLALRIAINTIADSAYQASANGTFDHKFLDADFIEAMRTVLRNPALDAAFKELVLTLPSETYIAEQLNVVDPQRIHAVREAMREQLALALQADWEWAWEQNQDTGGYRPDPVSSGRRALSGLALQMLCIAARRTGDVVWPGKAYQRFKVAANMTDRFNALTALVASGSELAAPALARFHTLFKDEPLVIDKWFALQAGAPDRGGNVLPAVRQLMQHPDFSLKNPNRARSVIFSYCSANPGAFHRADAAGYVFWSDRVIELDAINPQVAARLARALDRWKKLAEPWRSGAREAIARVAARPDLSNDVREVVTRALAE